MLVTPFYRQLPHAARWCYSIAARMARLPRRNKRNETLGEPTTFHWSTRNFAQLMTFSKDTIHATTRMRSVYSIFAFSRTPKYLQDRVSGTQLGRWVKLTNFDSCFSRPVSRSVSPRKRPGRFSQFIYLKGCDHCQLRKCSLGSPFR